MGKNRRFNVLKEIVVIIVISYVISIPFLTNGSALEYLQRIGISSCPYLDFKEFHGDENYWLRNTKYFKLFYMDKAIYSEEWKKFDAYDQPPVGKYIIGLALFVTGQKDKIRELQRMNNWNFGTSYDWNVSHGTVPPEKPLRIARSAVALFGILTCLLIYYIGSKAFGIKTGIIASLLLAYNPLMISWSRRAMTDTLLLFFLALNVVFIIFFYQSFLKQKTIRTFNFAALIGIDAALATGTKLNGGITGIIFASFCILLVIIRAIQYRISERSLTNKLKMIKDIKIVIGSLLISVFIATVVFIGINPYLYHGPFRKTVKMIEHRTSMIHRQQQQNPQEILTSLSEKFNSVLKRTMLPENYVILSKILKVPVDFVLFVLGLVMLLYAESKYFLKEHKFSLKSIILLWLIITSLGMIIWIPLDWERYYLPVILCVVVIVGYGMAEIIDKCWVIIKKTRERAF